MEITKVNCMKEFYRTAYGILKGILVYNVSLYKEMKNTGNKAKLDET